jgi:amidase
MAQTRKTKHGKSWQHIAEETQEYRDATIDRVHPAVPRLPLNLPTNVVNIPRETLSLDEVQITEMPPEDLLDMLGSGGLTATVTVKAFLRRAGLAQRLVRFQRHSILPIPPIPMPNSRIPDKLHY